ncbi:MAG: hypothetical protein C5B51_18640 [Terriglobia bacterium]|nr:MAG: hypothetical protein C5B51_18640 [Terriglobia bacterium]
MTPNLRLAYTIEFLIALFTAFEVWSQVGGQSHLDLMPWYLKLVLGSGTAWAAVRATMAAASHDRAWNAQTLRWIGILLALLVGCGLASYYYHLYEEQEEHQEESTAQTKMPVLPIRVKGLCSLTDEESLRGEQEIRASAQPWWNRRISS